jgi:hypothetical protein
MKYTVSGGSSREHEVVAADMRLSPKYGSGDTATATTDLKSG